MMGLAMPASRSLIALLVGTAVFFALWIVALKPSSSSKSGSGSSQGLGAYQSDINAARKAVSTSNANDAASGNENATSSSGGASSSQTRVSTTKSATTKTATSKVTHTTSSKPVAKTTAATTTAAAKSTLAGEVSTVQTAVSDHKVLALLFYNPAGADDQAVKQELAAVSTHKGQVVKLSIPLNEAASFTNVTQQVPVNLSPTLVLVSRTGNADELVGYTDPFTINQLVENALASS